MHAKYGRLTVLEERKAPATDTTRTHCLCKCDCGAEVLVVKHRLLSGLKKSCGCIHRERQHGMSGKGRPVGQRTRMYGVWKGMKCRCNCKTATGYQNYGGRGIRVCEEWNSFAAFRDFIMTLIPTGEKDIPRGLDIERRDNDGHYEPSNVRLTTRSVNLCNKRDNVRVTLNGETKALAEWCRVYGVTFSAVVHRVRRMGWDYGRALATPSRKAVAA